MRKLVGLDIETVDPLLKEAGWSWKYNKGFILCTALYFADTDKAVVYAGLNNEHTIYSKEERIRQNDEIKSLLKDPEVSIVGANLQYDIGWLLHEYSMSTYDVKCRFIDVLQAEHILDEFTMCSLDSISWKYLRYGKKKERIEDWVHEYVQGAKGDFRKYLKDAPWNLLEEYVLGDAQNPVHIWKKQLTLLKEQNLCERCKIEFDCILPILRLTINGFPFDNERRKIYLNELSLFRDEFAREFSQKYHFKEFNVNSSKHIAKLCDKLSIPYRCKIALKGYNNKPFASATEKDEFYNIAKKLVTQMRLVKGDPIAFVPVEMSERTVDLLEEHGFMCTCSPNVDKKFFASQRENYPVIATIADWKVCNGIISKILDDSYADRFLCPDGKIRPQFNITDTLSFRLSSNKPNGQQIPSKGGVDITSEMAEHVKTAYPHLTVKTDDKGSHVSFPDITRSLFEPEKGCAYFKIDYGQIEYRLICNIAVGDGSKEVRQQYKDNPRLDFHQYVVNLTGLSRKFAKNMSFGVSFGMGLKSMCENFGWSAEHGQEISDKYHEHMPFVAPTLALVGDVAKERGYIRTVCGSHARLPDKKRSYTMLNRYTQGSGAEILKCAVIQAYNEGVMERLNFHIQVHDELGFSVPPVKERIADAYRMSYIMAHSCEDKLKIPLIADIELGDNWQNVREVKEWIELRDTNDDKWNSTTQAVRDCVNLCEQYEKENEI
jgi:DNA polymerase I - 3''-5'' exonuclease and polymerase domains